MPSRWVKITIAAQQPAKQLVLWTKAYPGGTNTPKALREALAAFQLDHYEAADWIVLIVISRTS